MDKVCFFVGLLLVCTLVFWGDVSRSAELNDPMRPQNYQGGSGGAESSAEKARTETWKLSAILRSKERSVAVINGKALQTGDVFEGFTLVKIYENRVVLRNQKRKLVLQRSGSGLKKNNDQRK